MLTYVPNKGITYVLTRSKLVQNVFFYRLSKSALAYMTCKVLYFALSIKAKTLAMFLGTSDHSMNFKREKFKVFKVRLKLNSDFVIINVRTYVIHLLETYVNILCNWLIL